MARRVVRRSRVVRARRKLVWARTVTTNPLNAEGDGGSLGFSSPLEVNLLGDFEVAYGANLIGCTVMRVRGFVSAVNDRALPITLPTNVRVGLKVTDKTEVQAATGSLFDPVSGAHDDWMGFYPLLVLPSAVQAYGGVSSSLVDIKSSRKVEELGESLMMCVSARAAGQGVPDGRDLGFYYDLSVLVALP